MTEELIEEGDEEEVVDKEGRKYITAALSVESDAYLIKGYTLARRVGLFSNVDLLRLGVEAAKKTDQFKKAAADIKELI